MTAARRTAIVTGGARGIGWATTERLLADGYAVVVGDLDPTPLPTRDALAQFAVDVADEAAVARLVATTVERHGRLDALVNNAGRFVAEPLATLSLASLNRTLATNLTGPLLCAKHAAPHLHATGGSIVNVASTRAVMSEPHTEAYAASKGGLVALTHALALSLGPTVRVNCVSPGYIDVSASHGPPAQLSAADHAQHPVGRVGRPEDVASAIAWLLSDQAGFVTGAHLVLDGGMTRKMIYV